MAETMVKSMQQHIHFIKLTDLSGLEMFVNSVYVQGVMSFPDEDFTRVMIGNNHYGVKESLEYIMDCINEVAE